MKLVEFDDLIYHLPPSSNSEKTSTLVKTTDGKHYAIYLDHSGMIHLREAKLYQ